MNKRCNWKKEGGAISENCLYVSLDQRKFCHVPRVMRITLWKPVFSAISMNSVTDKDGEGYRKQK